MRQSTTYHQLLKSVAITLFVTPIVVVAAIADNLFSYLLLLSLMVITLILMPIHIAVVYLCPASEVAMCLTEFQSNNVRTLRDAAIHIFLI